MILKTIRDQIDIIDSKILKLLNERMEQAIIAKKFKSQVEDSGREREILQKIEKDSSRLINPDFCETLFKEIINESKRLQKKDLKIIGFQGEHGAYSEVAAKNWNKKLVSVPCSSFGEVFEGIVSGLYDYGVMPVENTLGGVVGQVNELLMNTKLYVVGAVEQTIQHCLMAYPGADHREIRRVYSHSQALAQCKHFLLRNKLEPKPYYDTAGAAKMLSEEKPASSAVIASGFAAKLYNLDIIKENVEDLKSNSTRFFILAKKKSSEPGNKCTAIFSTSHKAGTLFNVLELFAKKDINLTRIESMPKNPGNYAFFLDFEGSDKDGKIVDVIKGVKKITSDFRLMGCYRERKIG